MKKYQQNLLPYKDDKENLIGIGMTPQEMAQVSTLSFINKYW